jgi:hypothetical protein
MLTDYGLPGVFLMLGLVPLVPAVLLWRYGTETSRRVLEEVSP